MPSIRQPLPTLLNGVSQQPPSLRHPSQGKAQVNLFSSLSEGLRKRPPTVHEAKLSVTASADTIHTHFINRDPTERYVVLIYDAEIKVYDLINKAFATVNVSNGTSFSLDQANSTQDGRAFRVYTPSTATTIGIDSTITGTATLVWEKADDEAFTSGVTTIATHNSTTSATPAWTPATDNGKWVRCRVSAWTSGVVSGELTWQDVSYIVPTSGTDYDAELETLTIHDFTFIVNTGITVKADLEQNQESVTYTKQTFADLSGVAPSTGEIAKLFGDDTTNFDEYYVKYSASGVWEEYFKPGSSEENAYELATMPFTLVREANGDFTLSRGSWLPRVVGDSDSSPMPNFVGETIQDIVFFRDRLGFLSADTISLSRIGTAPGGYFSFFPETVTAVLDSGPIETSMPHTRVALLQNGVVFNESLLLFSATTQFLMDATGNLTPSTFKVSPTTEFSVAGRARPLPLGNNVYFAVLGGDYSLVREYFVDESAVVNDAADITAHVNKFIPSPITKLTGTSNLDLLIALTDGNMQRLYVYKYYWDVDTKAQSAWSYWEFDSDSCLCDAEFIDDKLWLVNRRSDSVYLESITFNADASEDDLDVVVHLDRRTAVTGTYDSGTGNTTWSLPYDTNSLSYTIVRGSDFGDPGATISIDTTNTASLVTAGDYSDGDCWIGVSYESSYTFSEQFVRKRQGDSFVAQIVGRLQLKRMIIQLTDTGYLRAEVTPEGRSTTTREFSPSISGTYIIGDIPLGSGSFQFPILARSSNVTIKLVNDTWLPNSILSAEWIGVYSQTPVLPPLKTV